MEGWRETLGMCPVCLLAAPTPFSIRARSTKAEGLGRGHRSKKPVQEDSDLQVPSMHHRALVHSGKELMPLECPSFAPRGGEWLLTALSGPCCLGSCECSGLIVTSPTSPF